MSGRLTGVPGQVIDQATKNTWTTVGGVGGGGRILLGNLPLGCVPVPLAVGGFVSPQNPNSNINAPMLALPPFGFLALNVAGWNPGSLAGQQTVALVMGTVQVIGGFQVYQASAIQGGAVAFSKNSLATISNDGTYIQLGDGEVLAWAWITSGGGFGGGMTMLSVRVFAAQDLLPM